MLAITGSSREEKIFDGMGRCRSVQFETISIIRQQMPVDVQHFLVGRDRLSRHTASQITDVIGEGGNLKVVVTDSSGIVQLRCELFIGQDLAFSRGHGIPKTR